MKKILIAYLLFAATVATAQDYSVDPMPAPIFRGIFKDKNVTLDAGTFVLLETNEKIESGAVTVGQSVQFKVRTQVIAEGEVAIRTGAMAVGRVKAIESNTHNSPEEIRIELSYVQSVDGQMLPLNGNEQTIRGTFPGQAASIDPGTAITAYIMNRVNIHHD